MPEPDTKPEPPQPFCIYSTDPFALAVIRGWIITAHAHKVNPDKIRRAEKHFAEIKRYQLACGTKLPD